MAKLEQRTLVTGRTIGLLTAALGLFGFLAATSDTFLSGYTSFILSRQVAFFVLIALAQAVCLVVGGMNLAVGAIGSIATVVLGLCLQEWGLSPWLAVPLVLLTGGAAGLLNGLLITLLKIDSFIVTLSMMFVYMGLRSGISGGQPYKVPLSYTFIGQEKFLGVPYVFIIMFCVLLGLGYMYRSTVFGRRMLAVGGNADAARLSGISTDNMIVGANVLSGLLSALAAVLWASELGSAAPETGDAWLIVSFAVAIIGGTGLTGGSISAFGILMGGVIYTLIRHGLIEIKANPYFMNVYIGILILNTIAVDRIRATFGELSAERALLVKKTYLMLAGLLLALNAAALCAVYVIGGHWPGVMRLYYHLYQGIILNPALITFLIFLEVSLLVFPSGRKLSSPRWLIPGFYLGIVGAIALLFILPLGGAFRLLISAAIGAYGVMILVYSTSDLLHNRAVDRPTAGALMLFAGVFNILVAVIYILLAFAGGRA